MEDSGLGGLDKIFKKYVGKKHGYDFKREVRHELQAKRLVRLLAKMSAQPKDNNNDKNLYNN